MYEVVAFIVCHVETLFTITRVQNLRLMIFAATLLFIHCISLTTDQGACEAVICISIGTMDYIKSKTNSLNLVSLSDSEIHDILYCMPNKWLAQGHTISVADHTHSWW